eukprot:11758207-Ditylum_brightwellii.AAC.1
MSLELSTVRANKNIYSKYRKYKQKIEKYDSQVVHARTHDQPDEATELASVSNTGKMVAIDGRDSFVVLDQPDEATELAPASYSGIMVAAFGGKDFVALDDPVALEQMNT